MKNSAKFLSVVFLVVLTLSIGSVSAYNSIHNKEHRVCFKNCMENKKNSYIECKKEFKNSYDSCLSNFNICKENAEEITDKKERISALKLCVFDYRACLVESRSNLLSCRKIAKDNFLQCKIDCISMDQNSCSTNSDCSQSDFCEKNSCEENFGECQMKPIICPAFFSPVCGCDGVTYGNDCERELAGIVLDHVGLCA